MIARPIRSFKNVIRCYQLITLIDIAVMGVAQIRLVLHFTHTISRINLRVCNDFFNRDAAFTDRIYYVHICSVNLNENIGNSMIQNLILILSSQFLRINITVCGIIAWRNGEL